MVPSLAQVSMESAKKQVEAALGDKKALGFQGGDGEQTYTPETSGVENDGKKTSNYMGTYRYMEVTWFFGIFTMRIWFSTS